MSLEFDWRSLSPFIADRLTEAIESVPADGDPMLRSTIKVLRVTMGDIPPSVALTRIGSLHLDEQNLGVSFAYKGNAELEILLDLDLNAVGNQPSYLEANRFMNTIYTEAPLVTRCRVLVSAVDISVKVDVTHGQKTFIRFEEPPTFSLCIDSNLCYLGPLFQSGMDRVVRIAKQSFRDLPEQIELPIGESEQ
jgi:hypothetical protein